MTVRLLCFTLMTVLCAGCGTRQYCFRIVDEDTREPLSGATASRRSAGHYLDVRPLPYNDPHAHHYGPTGADGVLRLPDVPAISGVYSVLEFQRAGYEDAGTGDSPGEKSWRLFSQPPATGSDGWKARTIPSAVTSPVVEIPLRRLTDTGDTKAEPEKTGHGAGKQDIPDINQ